MKYRLLEAALNDLYAIDDWVVENFGVAAADRTQARLFDAFELLADHPEMGRERPEVTRRAVRFFSQRPYWIVYAPGPPMRVHRVYHAARDLARLERAG